MSEIKDRDILKLLDGNASAKKLKSIEKWASEDPSHARELELFQRIYDELGQLSSYKRVDTGSEWAEFKDAADTQVSDVELLQYFDGVATPAQRDKVDQWKEESDENKEDFEIFDMIITESAHLQGYKSVDSANEWSSFKSSISSTNAKITTVPTPAPKSSINEQYKSTEAHKITPSYQPATSTYTSTAGAKEVAFTPAPVVQEETNRVWMWRSLAVAASLLLLSAFMWLLWQNNGLGLNGNGNQELFATFSTESNPDQITLTDGSSIALNEYSSVTYFTDVEKVDQRAVTLEGNGDFDIASNPQKPFIVKSPVSGVGVRVLGTRFKVTDHDKYQKVVENIEGSVRAYSLADTTVSVTMTAGDSYGFDGYRWINLKDVQEEYVGSEYKLLYVLDYLMEESNWNVTSAPYAPFNPDASVIINLDQDYEGILYDLVDQADFEYVPNGCEGCYTITRFLPLSSDTEVYE